MLYSYKEVKNKYKSDYQIKKAIDHNEIYKIEDGIYSDRTNVHYLEVITKKYPNAIISSHSAYYYHNLTDIISPKIYLATVRDSYKISNDRISQSFVVTNLFELGKTKIEYEGIIINIYDKERMLIELVRNKNNMGYDLYKDIIQNYRKISNILDISKIEKYIFNFNNGEKLFSIIQDEVF